MGTTNHILIHSVKAWLVWDLLLVLFRWWWVFPGTVKEVLLGWFVQCLDKWWKKVWTVAPLCFGIWGERKWHFLTRRMLIKSERVHIKSLLEWSIISLELEDSCLVDVIDAFNWSRGCYCSLFPFSFFLLFVAFSV